MMIRHLVMWKLKDYNQAVMLEIQTRLMALRGVVPQIQGTFEVVFGEGESALQGGYHLGLIADFADREALCAYRDHPAHKAVSAYVATVREERASLDFEL